MTYHDSPPLGHHLKASALGGSYLRPTETSARIQFRRGMTLTAMTLLLPGSAQIVSGNRRVGILALRGWFLLVAGVLGVAVIASRTRGGVLSLATSPIVLTLLTWGTVAVAIVWCGLLVDAWRIARPLTMARNHRLWTTTINAICCFAVVGSGLYAAQTFSAAGRTLDTVFAGSESSESSQGRYNVLLLGGDSGSDRQGMRPDSLTVASVDAKTGETVLIGLPRNLQDVPFPDGSVMAEKFGAGFDCDDCYLNSVNTWANDNAKLFADEFPQQKRPGIAVTKQAVEEITGLKINYYVMVNMSGFSKLIDAVGGVEVNVQERTAIGGIGSPIRGYIEPGRRRLNGSQALWYGRSRVLNDDFSRMGRQKCLISAMAGQLSPRTVLVNAQKIADSSSDMLTTDIPRQDVSDFMELGLKAKDQKMSSVSLVPPQIYPGSPDYDKVRTMVKKKIEIAQGRAATPGAGILNAQLKLPGPDDKEKPSAADPRRANQSNDVAATC